MLATVQRDVLIRRGGPAFQCNKRSNCFAPTRMGQPHYCSCGNCRVSKQDFLDPYRGHILAPGFDHVLFSVSKKELTVGVEHSDVARVVPTEFLWSPCKAADPGVPAGAAASSLGWSPKIMAASRAGMTNVFGRAYRATAVLR